MRRKVVGWLISFPFFFYSLMETIRAVDRQCTFQHVSLHDIQVALLITEAIHKDSALPYGAPIDNTNYYVANITTKYLNELQGEVLSVLIAKKESKGDRTTIIAFRGTDGLSKTIDQFKSNLEDYGETDVYFRGKKTSVNKYIWMSFSKLYYHIEHHLYEGDRRYIITGHSIGGAMASLLAAVTKSRNEGVAWKHPGTCLITFGAPRVGDSSYAQTHEELISPSRKFRFVNRFDVVPHLPTSSIYQHHSREIWINKENAQLSWNSVALLENPKRFTYWKICSENEPSYCSNRISDLKLNPFDHGLLKYRKTILNPPRVYYSTKGGRYTSWSQAMDASCPSSDEEYPFTLPRVQKTQTETEIENELPPEITTTADQNTDENMEDDLIAIPVTVSPGNIIEAVPEPNLPAQPEPSISIQPESSPSSHPEASLTRLSKDDSEILATNIESEANRLTPTHISPTNEHEIVTEQPITIIHTPDEIFSSNTDKEMNRVDLSHVKTTKDLNKDLSPIPIQSIIDFDSGKENLKNSELTKGNTAQTMNNPEVSAAPPSLLGRLIAKELEKDNVTTANVDDKELAAMTPSLNDGSPPSDSDNINLMTYNLMHRTKFDKGPISVKRRHRKQRTKYIQLGASPYKKAKFTQNNPSTSQIELTGNISQSERNNFRHFLTLVANKESERNTSQSRAQENERTSGIGRAKEKARNKLFDNYLTLVEHTPRDQFDTRGVTEETPKDLQPVNVIDIMKLYVPTRDLDTILNQSFTHDAYKNHLKKTNHDEQKPPFVTADEEIQRARKASVKTKLLPGLGSEQNHQIMNEEESDISENESEEAKNNSLKLNDELSFVTTDNKIQRAGNVPLKQSSMKTRLLPGLEPERNHHTINEEEETDVNSNKSEETENFLLKASVKTKLPPGLRSVQNHQIINEEENYKESDIDNNESKGTENNLLKLNDDDNQAKSDDVTRANFDDVTEEKNEDDGDDMRVRKDGRKGIEEEEEGIDPNQSNKVRIQVAL